MVQRSFRSHWTVALGILTCAAALYAVERNKPEPFREYPGDEYRISQIALPPILPSQLNGLSRG